MVVEVGMLGLPKTLAVLLWYSLVPGVRYFPNLLGLTPPKVEVTPSWTRYEGAQARLIERMLPYQLAMSW